VLSCTALVDCIEPPDGSPTRLSITPKPDVKAIGVSGEGSVSLRLGRWFLSLRQSSHPKFDVAVSADSQAEHRSEKMYFSPFGETFTLHPGRFVLAATLEWLKLGNDIGGYVTGKSTWARRGLIIETAAGVHPGFSGCLTLELTNVGEIPIVIRPGMTICQVFFHDVPGGSISSTGRLTGRRRPYLGTPREDPLFEALRRTSKSRVTGKSSESN